MKYSLQIVDRDEPYGLPVLATTADVREAIRFLKQHPDGITVVQAMDAFRKRIFDPRKVWAYEFWNIILRKSDRLKLTPLGWELAKCLTPEAQLYRDVLRSIEPYDNALQWIREQELELVTHLDIGQYWCQHHRSLLTSESDKQLEAYAATFFQICHAAEVGTLTLGRKGLPTRLHVYASDLESYFAESRRSRTIVVPNLVQRTTPTESRVLVSHYGAPTLLIEPIIKALELAELSYETLDRAERSIAETLDALERCNAGVFLITEEVGVDDQLLLQIGAALVQCERRLLLVVKRDLKLPADLGGAARCEIADDFTWEVAIELIRALKSFKAEQ